jgi:hypothetical protein
MSIISAIKECNVCRKEKRVVSESLFANGLYGYWCNDCDKAEGATHLQTSIKVR